MLRRLPKYVIVHGVVAPRQLVPFLNILVHEAHATPNSVYRGDDARLLLAKVGKHSQKWLYDHQGTPAQPYPANPPGYSTHELRNDGVAYPKLRRGATIPWWACGIDVNDSDVHRVIAVAAKHGWKVSQTYPNSKGEYHHLNFRRPPLLKRLAARVKP